MPPRSLRHIVLVDVDVFVPAPAVRPDDLSSSDPRFCLIARCFADDLLFFSVEIIGVYVPVAVPLILPDDNSVLYIRICVFCRTFGYPHLFASVEILGLYVPVAVAVVLPDHVVAVCSWVDMVSRALG